MQKACRNIRKSDWFDTPVELDVSNDLLQLLTEPSETSAVFFGVIDPQQRIRKG